MKLFRLLLILCCVVFSNQVYSYEVETHEEITDKAFRKSLSKRNFLGDFDHSSLYDKVAIKFPLPYSNGTDCPDCATKSILDWFKYGSKQEDYDYYFYFARFNNHFYDPYNDNALVSKFSSIKPAVRAPDWGLAGLGAIDKQYYSIRYAKEYYRKALTSETKEERENYLAYTFKTLGHVLHLIQDMAQPQHTRNDLHGGNLLGGSWGPQTFGEKSVFEKRYGEGG